jgi:hypothetical protein
MYRVTIYTQYIHSFSPCFVKSTLRKVHVSYNYIYTIYTLSHPALSVSHAYWHSESAFYTSSEFPPKPIDNTPTLPPESICGLTRFLLTTFHAFSSGNSSFEYWPLSSCYTVPLLLPYHKLSVTSLPLLQLPCPLLESPTRLSVTSPLLLQLPGLPLLLPQNLLWLPHASWCYPVPSFSHKTLCALPTPPVTLVTAVRALVSDAGYPGFQPMVGNKVDILFFKVRLVTSMSLRWDDKPWCSKLLRCACWNVQSARQFMSPGTVGLLLED